MVSTAGMFGDDDFSGLPERLARQIRAMTEPYRRTQEAIERILEPYDRLNQQIQQMVRPPVEIEKALRRTTGQVAAILRVHEERTRRFRKHLVADQLAARRDVEKIVAKVLPPGRIQKEMDSILSHILLGQGETVANAAQAISDSLAEYEPLIESTPGAIVIDGTAFTSSELEQALSKDISLSSPSRWLSLPKWLRWLILTLLATLLQRPLETLWIYFAYGQVPFAHWRQEPKAVVHQAKACVRSKPKRQYLPFVIRDHLPVFASPRKRSRKLDELPFATEVKILKFRKKKRWALIEWSLGEETHRGWVLGRYVFRPSKVRPSECESGGTR